MNELEVTQNLISLRESVNRLDEKLDRSRETILATLHKEISEFGEKVDAVEADLAGLKNWVAILDVKVKLFQWVGTSVAGILITSIIGLIWTSALQNGQHQQVIPTIQEIKGKNEPSGVPGRRTGGGTHREPQSQQK